MCADQKVMDKLSDSDKLRLLAEWIKLPTIIARVSSVWDPSNEEVQEDLRRIAIELESKKEPGEEWVMRIDQKSDCGCPSCKFYGQL